MDRVPTRDEIEAISSLPELVSLSDEIAATIIKIETQLQHRYHLDQNREQRAIDALGIHRNAARLVKRRIEVVKAEMDLPKAYARRHRPESENSPSTNAALPRRTQYNTDMSGLETVEECERWAAEIRRRVDEVSQDRADEMARPPHDRDHGFLAATAALLKAWGAQQQALQTHSAMLRREQRKTQADTRALADSLRFVEAARQYLTRDVYLGLWAAVGVDRADDLHPTK